MELLINEAELRLIQGAESKTVKLEKFCQSLHPAKQNYKKDCFLAEWSDTDQREESELD
jgi:hypothetical protein